MSLPDGLLDAAKNYLDITFEDPAGDTKLAGILLRGMKRLDSIAGAPQDYAVEDSARALLFDYARYVRAGAMDEFFKNYQSDLLELQMNTVVSDSSAEEGG
ncbi:MAG TPA: hypothetical protein PKB13_08370 [Clostridia bacterium]|nr:hypothetical protein [Clostridia bacterium]